MDHAYSSIPRFFRIMLDLDIANYLDYGDLTVYYIDLRVNNYRKTNARRRPV